MCNNLISKPKISCDLIREDGYPDLICRKCCHIISTFHTYKKTVDDGMARLSQEVAKQNNVATRILTPSQRPSDDLPSSEPHIESVQSRYDCFHQFCLSPRMYRVTH